MILSSLDALYHRLLANPNPITGLPKVPNYGFTDEKIGCILIISRDGKLIEVNRNLEEIGKKWVPRLSTVPWSFDRPGKFTRKAFDAGKNPSYFLWDKPKYLLGLEPVSPSKGNKDWGFKVCELEFEASQKLHTDLLNWHPTKFDKTTFNPELLQYNFAFRLDGCLRNICEQPAAVTSWEKHVHNSSNPVRRRCLVSNQLEPVKGTHAAIKGGFLVAGGAQTSGSKLVSYNEKSFTSYLKEQGDNAPISEQVAFAYSSALNFLLRIGNEQCVRMGDATVVFWANASNEVDAKNAESLFSTLLNQKPNSAQEQAKIQTILNSIVQANLNPSAGVVPDPSTEFFILALAPNGPRLSIRFWLQSTFGRLAKNIATHINDLALAPDSLTKAPSLDALLLQTVPHRKSKGNVKKKWDYKLIPPNLNGELLRAVLNGQRYPTSLLARIVLRIRSDGDIHPLRVRILKAIVCRDDRLNSKKESIAMSLNREELSIAYRLGRLFSVYESAQNAALGELNAGIRDRFYGSASSTPRIVFPMLDKNFIHHLSKLRRGAQTAKWIKTTDQAARLAHWLDREVEDIYSTFEAESGLPKTLTLVEQASFIVGYYHQKNDRKATKAGISIAEQEPENVDEEIQLTNIEG
jgi:CRISPR-associated protein Csd1